MAPKRTAGGAAAASKRRKANAEPAPADDLEIVASALHQAEARVSKLLVPMLETSLGVFRDKRHRFQHTAVGMVASVLDELESAVRKHIAEAEAKIADSHGERAELETAVKDAEAALAKRRDETLSKREVLVEDAKAFQAAKQSVDSAKAVAQSSEQEVKVVAENKVLVEAALNEFAKPLAEGAVDSEEALRLTESLMAVLKKFSFDDSMLSALPAALTKEPSSRGPFDTTVLTQLQHELAHRIAGLEQRLKEAEREKAQSVERLHEEEANFDRTREGQLKAALAFNEAREQQRLAEEALEAAKKALARLTPAANKLKKVLSEAEAHLSKFLEGPKKAFERLKDRVSPTTEEDSTPAQPMETEVQKEEKAESSERAAVVGEATGEEPASTEVPATATSVEA